MGNLSESETHYSSYVSLILLILDFILSPSRLSSLFSSLRCFFYTEVYSLVWLGSGCTRLVRLLIKARDVISEERAVQPGEPLGNQFAVADAQRGRKSAVCTTAALSFCLAVSRFPLLSSLSCSLNWSHLNYLLFQLEVKHFITRSCTKV